MLIVMAGLPAAGKSTIAGALAQELECALLSVDPIEAAMWRAGIERNQPTGLAAYVVAEDLAREQLLLGNDVIVDAVNDAEEARAQWKSQASTVTRPLGFVEVFCSDEAVHRERLVGRQRGIGGFPEPTWSSVIERRTAFDRWDDARLRLDSMLPVDDNLALALDYVETVRHSYSA